MNIKQLHNLFLTIAGRLRDIPPLCFRLILAYGFYGTAVQKISHFSGTVDWFTELGYPLPELNAYMAAGTESLGVCLLLLGLGTRYIAVPLMFVMVVAISTVHWSNGFGACNGGYQIALYFFVMLFSLVCTGAGRISLDYLLTTRFQK